MFRKGMSQTLTLIVAASVLMMTALTVIFMVQGGLTNTEQGLAASSCTQTINAQCSGNTQSITPPSTCYSDGKPVAGAPSGLPDTRSPTAEYTCPGS